MASLLFKKLFTDFVKFLEELLGGLVQEYFLSEREREREREGGREKESDYFILSCS